MLKIIVFTAMLFAWPLSMSAHPCNRLHVLDLDSEKIYQPGQMIRYEQAHGSYSGLFSADSTYFVCPVTLTVKERSAAPSHGEEHENGSLLLYVRHATDSHWTKEVFDYGCEGRSLEPKKMEFAELSGTQMEVGSRNSICMISKSAK